MSVWILISGACILVSVKSHPLVQNIQSYPITNYQHHVYRVPYTDAFILQPSNMNDFYNPPLVQIPVSTYQNLQTPTLTEQISQLYWDKLMSNPSLRKMLVANKIVPDWIGKEIQTNIQSYDTGGVLNRYDIMPSDYLKLNDTVSKQNETKKVRKKLRKPVKEHVSSNQKRKKMLSNNRVNVDDSQLSNFKKQRKIKQNVENSWNFNTDNIKCFTPADVLKSEKYQPETKVYRNKVNNHCYTDNSKMKPTSSDFCENKAKKRKSRKKKKNNTHDTVKKKTKQSKQVPRVRKYAKNGESPDCVSKISEINSQHCIQDINDIFLSNLVQQDCTNLENRHTRNSNADTALKDIRSMYPDLPNDLSKTLTWYMNDFFSPHSLQQAFTSNSFPGNNYPFDFSQIYQIPTFSNSKVINSKANSEKNSNARRKKKKKKNSKAKSKENASNSDNGDHNDIISEKNIQIPEAHVKITDISLISDQLEKNIHVINSSTEMFETINHDPDIHNAVTKKNTQISSISPDKDASISNETKPIDFTTVIPKTITTKTVSYNPIISSENDVEYMKHQTDEVLDDKNTRRSDQYLGSEEEEFKEIYETQIPYSVVLNINKKNNTQVLKDETIEIDDMSLHPNNYNQFNKFETEDELFRMFVNDYYPDFRAHNHAYLLSDEEIDVRNINDRYFYVTDRNINMKDFLLPDQENILSRKESIYSEEDLGNYNILEHNDNNNIVKNKDTLQEIIFRTPPALDAPDFITRKVNQDTHDSTEFYYQHKNFEDNLDRFNLDHFAHDSDKFIEAPERTSDNNSGHLVETVYARSKVVKYGQGQELTKSHKPETKTNVPNLANVATQNDGETTVVMAKSVRPEEYNSNILLQI